MTKCCTYEKMMDPEESIELFDVGEHPWNLVSRDTLIHNPARRSAADLSSVGWERGMPIPEMVAPHRSGIEVTLIAVQGEDGIVYTGTATRYYDPAQFRTKKHKVTTQFMLGDDQFTLHLDDRMKQLGFEYSVDEPTP